MVVLLYILLALLIIGPYLAFFGGLLVLTIKMNSKLSTRWRIFLVVLWATILIGHSLVLLLFIKRGDNAYFNYFILGSVLIGLGAAGFVFPLSSIKPILKSSKIGRRLGILASSTILASALIALVTNGTASLSRVEGGVLIVFAAILACGVAGLVSALKRRNNLLLLIGLVLFVLSYMGFMSIGVVVMPLALLFLASGITLQASRGGSAS